MSWVRKLSPDERTILEAQEREQQGWGPDHSPAAFGFRTRGGMWLYRPGCTACGTIREPLGMTESERSAKSIAAHYFGKIGHGVGFEIDGGGPMDADHFDPAEIEE